MFNSETIKKIEKILKFDEKVNKKADKLQLIEFCINIIKAKNSFVMPDVAAALYIIASENEHIIRTCINQFDNNIDRVLYYLYILLNPVSKGVSHEINHQERRHICHVDSPARLYFDMSFDAYKTFIDNYKALDLNPNPITYHEKHEFIKLTEFMKHMIEGDRMYEKDIKLKQLAIDVMNYINEVSQ